MKAELELKQLDQTFSALSHRTRRQILHILQLRGGRVTGGQIADRFSCKWPTVSRHLLVLREAGLIKVSREGREWIYSANLGHGEDLIRSWFVSVGSSGALGPVPVPTRRQNVET